MVNAELVRRGYAQVMTVPPNVRHQELFVKLQREAREQKRGLWADPSEATTPPSTVTQADRQNSRGQPGVAPESAWTHGFESPTGPDRLRLTVPIRGVLRLAAGASLPQVPNGRCRAASAPSPGFAQLLSEVRTAQRVCIPTGAVVALWPPTASHPLGPRASRWLNWLLGRPPYPDEWIEVQPTSQ